MKKTALAALAFAAALSGCARSASARAVAEVGQPAPAFQLAGLNGRTVALSDYKGKVVLLNFWASWCPECVEELPALQAVYLKHRAEGFEVVAASVDDQGRKAVLPFLAAAKVPPTFTVCLADDKTSRAYAIHSLPASFLVGADGRVVKTYIGAVDPVQLENDILQQLPRRRS